MHRIAPWLAFAALLAACSEDDETALDAVVIEADPQLAERIDTVRISLTRLVGDARTSHVVEVPAEHVAGRMRAITERLSPERGSGRDDLYRVRAEGMLDGGVLITAQHRLTFLTGRVITVPLRFTQPCVDVECSGDTTCVAGACIDDFLPECAFDRMPDPECNIPAPPSIDSGTRDGAMDDDGGSLPREDVRTRDAMQPTEDGSTEEDGGSTMLDGGGSSDDGGGSSDDGGGSSDDGGGSSDASSMDGGMPVADASTMDSGAMDAGAMVDARAMDARFMDTGTMDGSPTADATPMDAVARDSGRDVGPMMTGDVGPSDAAPTLDSSTGSSGDDAATASDGAAGCACPDDGLPCTMEVCAPGCMHVPVAGQCAIGGTCYAAGEPNPTNGCELCNPADPTSWFPRANGAGCDDGLFCTATDACDGAGRCEGRTSPCSSLPGDCAATCDETTDGCRVPADRCLIGGECYAAGEPNPTRPCQSCDPVRAQTAWTNAPSGSVCNDGMACTLSSLCTASGECMGPLISCGGINTCVEPCGMCVPPGGDCGFMP